jgi:hypothetical protein
MAMPPTSIMRVVNLNACGNQSSMERPLQQPIDS